MEQVSTIQGMVEVLAHDGSKFEEQMSVICESCDNMAVPITLPYYKNAKVRYEDGVENFWEKFFVVDKKVVCSSCLNKRAGVSEN